MSKYSELLRDPKWQKKRLKILERDKFQCRACEATEETLHVHHIIYDYKLKPWEYLDCDLITLCEYCHSITYLLERSNADLIYVENVTKCINKQMFDNMDKGIEERRKNG